MSKTTVPTSATGAGNARGSRRFHNIRWPWHTACNKAARRIGRLFATHKLETA
jgi:hypothetical protein